MVTRFIPELQFKEKPFKKCNTFDVFLFESIGRKTSKLFISFLSATNPNSIMFCRFPVIAALSFLIKSFSITPARKILLANLKNPIWSKALSNHD